jgi:hypothetical protein
VRVYFATSVYIKTSEKKSGPGIDSQSGISEEIFPSLLTNKVDNKLLDSFL